MDKKLLFILTGSILTLALLVFFVATGWDYFVFQKPEVIADITIDFDKELGTFSPYVFGTQIVSGQGYKLAQEAGFKLISPAAVLPLILPENYDFSELDRDISGLFEIGAEPLVIMPGPDRKLSDTSAFANSVKALATHLKSKNDNKAWPNNGKVKVFRFGNEPDNSGYWKSTKQDFFETFAVAARTLKSVDPSFIIDGPGLMIGIDEINGSLGPWVKDFLDYCNKNNVPVDFFSTHLYSPSPYSFYENFGILQNELKKYPNLSPIYGTPKLANDEWNIMVGDLWSGSYHKQFDTAWLAGNNIAALINMIKQGLGLSTHMSAITSGACNDYVLIDCNGNGKPAYYAFKGFNWLYNTSRLSTEGDDHMNFAAIAGKSDNGVTVVISNYDVKTYVDKYEPRKIGNGESLPWRVSYNTYVSQFGQPKVYNKFNLTLDNLPWTSSQQITYERYLVDDSHKLELVESQTLSGSKEMKFSEDIAAPSVQVIKLTVK